MSRIGLIGTGLMGSAIARRLLARGWDVVLWNREPEALPPLVALGATAALSPRVVAEAAETVLFCVLDTGAVQDCVFGPDGFATARRAGLVLDLSTIDPDATRAFASRLREQTGAGWVDAPVSGGPAAAEAGRLAIMAGGMQADLDRAQPVLAELAANLTRMGPVGAGQTAKLVNQALVGTGFVLMAEALALAEAAGIDAALVPQCLAGGLAESTLLKQVYPAMQQRAFHPRMGHASQLGKDMRAVQEFTRRLDLTLPLIEAAARRYLEFVASAHGQQDSREIVRMYAPAPPSRPPTDLATGTGQSQATEETSWPSADASSP